MKVRAGRIEITAREHNTHWTTIFGSPSRQLLLKVDPFFFVPYFYFTHFILHKSEITTAARYNTYNGFYTLNTLVPMLCWCGVKMKQLLLLGFNFSIHFEKCVYLYAYNLYWTKLLEEYPEDILAKTPLTARGEEALVLPYLSERGWKILCLKEYYYRVIWLSSLVSSACCIPNPFF